jgi:hypothetical protein
LASQGFRVVAYGAAAKGMVLLHFLRQLQPRNYAARSDLYSVFFQSVKIKLHECIDSHLNLCSC